MPSQSLESKLERLVEVAVSPRIDDFGRNLIHAYAGCLSLREACDAAILTLEEAPLVRRAIRNRLHKLSDGPEAVEQLDALSLKLLELRVSGKTRETVNALLSDIYWSLSPERRQRLLDHWLGRRAYARWLRAMGRDELLFAAGPVLEYWRVSGDLRAAKLLAYQADPDLLTTILPELIQGSTEGWIVSKAMLRAGTVSDESWEAVRTQFPASYAYLCAKLGRKVSDEEAYSIVMSAAEADGGQRGLAIWAVGQMGLIDVLDRIHANASEIREMEVEQLFRKFPSIRAAAAARSQGPTDSQC